jgi:uncharacterized DUF497 family protein
VHFEWNAAKATANQRKHGVSFHEAASVFFDPLSATAADPDHSQDEKRFMIFGMSSLRRLLAVAHTERGDGIRIISAREVTHSERKFYEES